MALVGGGGADADALVAVLGVGRDGYGCINAGRHKLF
jgi:hypothetical protein